LYREVGDRQSVAALLHNLGEVALVMEDRAVARARFEQSLGHSRDLGDEEGIGLALDGLARITPSPDAALRPI
jgi:hypothetical protein